MLTASKERPILFSGSMVQAILDGRKTQTRRVVKPQPPADAEGVGPNSYEGPEGPSWFWWKGGTQYWPATLDGARPITCPYGVPGDRLWVRETFFQPVATTQMPGGEHESYRTGSASDIRYAADGAEEEWVDLDDRGVPTYGSRWRGKRPSIHMPRWASRITLEVVSVRVERVQEIDDGDAIFEGVDSRQVDLGDRVGRRWVAPGVEMTNCMGDVATDVAWYMSARDAFRELWDSINAKRGYGWDANPWVWVVEFKRVREG